MESVEGTGPDGRITIGDVKRAQKEEEESP